MTAHLTSFTRVINIKNRVMICGMGFSQSLRMSNMSEVRVEPRDALLLQRPTPLASALSVSLVVHDCANYTPCRHRGN